MDAIECLVTRRSIRNYTKEPVSAGDIENVVEIAQMVSCWENTQPVRYVAVLDNDLKNRIADECTKKFPWNTENIHEAPALIVLCTVKGFPAMNRMEKRLRQREPTGSLLMRAWRRIISALPHGRWIWGRSLWDGMTKKRSKKFLIFPKSMMCPASLRWAIPKSYPLRMKESL